MAESLSQRAAAAVMYERPSARRIKGTIATNTGFKPKELSQAGGVDPTPEKSPEVIPAQEALVRGVLDQLGEIAPVLTIQQWITRESNKRGGKGQLAAAILGIPYQRGGKGRPGMGKNRAYMNLLRALQRSAPATKTGRKEEHKGLDEKYRDLVANFPAGAYGNPYTPVRLRGLGALEVSKAQFTIWGDWSISSRAYDFAQRGTDLVAATPTFDAIWNYPPSLIDEVVAWFWASAVGEGKSQETREAIASVQPELDWLYGLDLLIELPEASNG